MGRVRKPIPPPGDPRRQKITNKKYIAAVKKAASYIKGYQTDNIFDTYYLYNRYYNLLPGKCCWYFTRRRFHGTRIELIQALRDCGSFDEDDIEQELHLAVIAFRSKRDDRPSEWRIFWGTGVRTDFFYINTKKQIAHYLMRTVELTNPVKRDLDFIPCVNLRTANLEDVLYQDPEKNVEYNNLLKKLTPYERDILFLMFEMDEDVNDIPAILGVGEETYVNDKATLYNKIRRYYLYDEWEEVSKPRTRNLGKTERIQQGMRVGSNNTTGRKVKSELPKYRSLIGWRRTARRKFPKPIQPIP